MTSSRTLSRREFLNRAGVAALAVGVSGPLLEACSGSSGPDTLKVGVVAPFSGPASFLGVATTNGLSASVRHLNATGGLSGRKVELLLRDSGAEAATGVRQYEELAGNRDVVGIVWAGGTGFDQVLPAIGRHGLPTVVAYDDPFSAGQLYPQGQAAGRSMFQVSPADSYVKAALASYAARDRGYRSAALLYDPATDPAGGTRSRFENAFRGAGMSVSGAETFTTGAQDLGPQLGRLAMGRPQVLYIDGSADDTATAVDQLATMGASYVDRPTAQGPVWHPQVFGSPTAMADPTWATTAGEAAKVGTLTALHLGGLVYLPGYAVGSWMKRFLGSQPVGREDAPADALATILNGVKQAGKTDRQSIVSAIETMRPTSFASTPFGYARDRHIARTQDDMVLATIEYLSGPVPTTPPYQLGREWSVGQLYEGASVAPTQLVRPTLAANRRAQPDLVKTILDQGWGTQCTKLPDGTLSPACKVH